MGKQYKKLSLQDKKFIQKQNLFYIASASKHEVNLSPRGYDSLYIQDEKTLYMVDYLGSGNRTARDINEDGEITLLFNAFEGAPKILRCFCKGEVFAQGSEAYQEASVHFDVDLNGIRQIFKFSIYAVESSCGMGVPEMEFKKERSEVRDYALKMYNNNKFNSYVQEHETPPDLKKL